jgi:hypothetical protein
MPAHNKKENNKSFTKFYYALVTIIGVAVTFFILTYSFGFNGYIQPILNTFSPKPETSNNVEEDFSNNLIEESESEILIGPAGPIGPKGEKGDKGDPGATGKTGKTGPVGPSGPTGATGSSGATGPTGASGATGPAGATGAKGETGAQGPVGPIGPSGPPGPTGDKGEKGDPGTTTFGYRGSFIDTTTQTQTSINTPKAMELNTANALETSGVSITNNSGARPTRITVANSGTYNLQFSAQLARSEGHKGTVNAEIWIRVNESNISFSNGKVTLTGDEDTAKTVASWNFLIKLDAGQYVELMWSVDDLRLVMPTITTGLIGPSIPSLIVTMTQVG